ncbi:MAG: hypothetical protein IKO65_11175, partial [Victivallales bacterium]|nr:hypothetical protein [Victivallales bacterium]
MALICPIFADYLVTVQNGDQALFMQPVSVELTAEQLAFVQEGIHLVEESADGRLLNLPEYAVDATGAVPRLCWNLHDETAPGRLRRFRLEPRNTRLPAPCKTDLECVQDGAFITVRNSYFQLRHPVHGRGGIPQDILFRESGYEDSGIEFYDRLYHPGVGTFWAKNDPDATCQVVLETPQRVVVEAHTHFVADHGGPAVGNPEAVYRYIYSAYSPVVEVERVITREDASQKWNEAQFLQVCRRDRFYTTIHCGEPMQTNLVGPPDGEPRSFSFSQWGVFAAGQGAFGVGGTRGGGYDRGKHGFPYNLAAQNLGFPAGETERRQAGLIYFGPSRSDAGWYSRWLGSDRPTVTIQEVEKRAGAADEIGDIILDCKGMKIYFSDAAEGFGCRGIENLLGDQTVRFVFPQKTPTPLWNLAFKKPYEVRQQESDQPDFIETAWLSSVSDSVPTCSRVDDGLVFEWHGLDLPGEPGVVDVRCTIRSALSPAGESHWRIQVTNRSTQWGLAETQYPILAQVIRPGQGDAMLPDHNWGHRLYRNSFRTAEQTYPTYKCPMQFMAFNQGDAGLYIAAHDPGARPKRLKVSSTQEVSFCVHAENASQPGAGNGDDFAFCVAAYRGDWWQAAKRYRKWATSETPWTAKGPIASRTDYPRALVDASFWQRLTSQNKSTDAVASMMEELHGRIGR